ncbi:MAG: sigma-70 family RNA polymerase sigma factor [Propionibacteriaceae bacterium]|nr:sigma-70 family RNA polymerase sigma factor [Propionibacteriaceae bacterium]
MSAEPQLAAVEPLPVRTEADATHRAVERYGQMVFGVALTHTRNRGDADDVFQEVFLAYHRRQPMFNDDEHEKAWLLNATLKLAKKANSTSWRTRVVPISDDVEVPQDSFEFATDEQQRVFAALSSLPENYRTVLHLFYFEDQSVKQISEMLGISEAAAKMRLSRGRALMRENGGLDDE